MKSLTNCEIPSSNSLPTFYLSPVSLNVVPYPTWDPENCSRKLALNGHWKNPQIIATESQNRNLDAAFGTTFRISKCFQRSKKKL
jgi:hypothetical protein